MKIPPYLKQGDTIGILSTARKISFEEIQTAIQTIESWGLNVKIGHTVSNEHHQFSGTDEERLMDFQWMLDDDNINAIICARGGYGTVRIIDDIDFRKFIKKPKWIIGFSDVTILHSHIHSIYNIPTIHAPMAINFNNNTPESIQSIQIALFGKKINYYLPTHPLNRKGNVEGVLIGGNLSLLHTLADTSSDIKTENKILLIEDLDEYLYHIDRMMMQLKRSGKLNNLAALLIGGMNDMKDNAIPFGKTAEEIIKEHVEEFEYPVYFNAPFGHINNNLACKMGINAKIESQNSKIVFNQSS